MMQEGAGVFRLNFSHGTHEDHRKVIGLIREVEQASGASLCILQDLQGPKIRVGALGVDKLALVLNEEVTLAPSHRVKDAQGVIPVNYPGMLRDVRVGQEILMNDGKITLEVLRIGKDSIGARVTHGGTLRSHQGLNLPQTRMSITSLTEKDKTDLLFGLAQGVDWIALSFVRSAQDILDLRQIASVAGYKRIHVVAKIEKPEAIKNIRKIVRAADGIMVARGDLGVEIPMAMVPVVQKDIVKICNEHAKPVVIATHMMESMVERNRPTRAETNDVANAVIDGTDAVMLSAETAVGRYPVEAVREMCNIIGAVEEEMDAIYEKEYPQGQDATSPLSDALLGAACKLAKSISAKCIAGMTYSGYSGFRLSSHRPSCPIAVFSNNRKTLRILHLGWGITSFYYNRSTSTNDTIRDVAEMLKKHRYVRRGDDFVITASMPIDEKGAANTLKIHRVR